jgi:F0F1-type ATP synthase membrane subunit b/b'
MDLILNLPNSSSLFPEQYFYIVCAVIFILGLATVLGVFKLRQSAKNSSKSYFPSDTSSDKLPEDIEAEAYANAVKILDDARVQSLKILTSSQLKAQKSLEDASNISKDIKDSLNKKLVEIYTKQENSLQTTGAEMLATLKQAVESEKEENIKMLDASTGEIKTALLNEVDTFKDALKNETVATQRQIDDKLQKAYAEVDAEIHTYKAEKVKMINERIFQILSNISTQVIGGTLVQEDHERFIYDTLKDELQRAGFMLGESGK